MRFLNELIVTQNIEVVPKVTLNKYGENKFDSKN